MSLIFIVILGVLSVIDVIYIFIYRGKRLQEAIALLECFLSVFLVLILNLIVKKLIG